MRKVLRVLIILIASIFLLEFVFAFSSWHLDRNIANVLPEGKLIFIKGNQFKDSKKRVWKLQSQQNNMFHQPTSRFTYKNDFYPNFNVRLRVNRDKPNIKLLSETGRCSSFEAILQPDGTYLMSGKERSTYNYCHPKDFFGKVGHLFVDVIPHLINSDYKI